MNKTTCQICEREIKSTTGVIAHHGYTRPNRGSGWQTASCRGARFLPYEVSCDQIQPCIDYIKVYVANQKNLVKELMENPPEKLTYVSFYSASKEFTRPENFNAKENIEQGSHRGFSYENEHDSQVRMHQREVETSGRDIKRLEKRLLEWKPQ